VLNRFSQNTKSLIKKTKFAYQSKVLALSNSNHCSTWLNGFLTTLKKEGFEDSVEVHRYISGNPNMILLELATSSGKGYLCRLPLGRGSSIPRAKNNFEALNELKAKSSHSRLIPQPVKKGEYQGQLYFIETLLRGHMVKLNTSNFYQIYNFVRPVLFSFYSELGQELVIDKTKFKRLFDQCFETIRRCALDNSDTLKIDTLESILMANLLGKKVRLPFVHSDFKIENMLFDSKGLSGIYDWDLSSSVGFPFIDLFYFYSYSFHHKVGGSNNGIIDFITTRLLTDSYDPLLEECYQDYRRSFGLSGEWKTLAGCLFWLHYVTKIMGISFSVSDGELFKKYVRKPIEIILKRLK
jgi:hypothetical protein